MVQPATPARARRRKPTLAKKGNACPLDRLEASAKRLANGHLSTPDYQIGPLFCLSALQDLQDRVRALERV